MRLRAAGADMVGVLVAGTVGVLAAALTLAAGSAALAWAALASALAWVAALAGAISAAAPRLSLAALRGSTLPRRAVPCATNGISIAAGASCRASVSASRTTIMGAAMAIPITPPTAATRSPIRRRSDVRRQRGRNRPIGETGPAVLLRGRCLNAVDGR